MSASSDRPADAGAANANIARHLSSMAAAQPGRVAVKVPRGRTRGGDIDYLALSFAEFDAEVNAWCARLSGAGVGRGVRTLVMVRQGLPLIASAFALFRLGAVPVIIDPGMGLRNFLACVRQAQPRALVGIPLAQLVSRVFRPSFRTVRTRVAASGSLTARLARARAMPASAGSTATAAAGDLAAVLFTSGSTGAPKGVCYEHGMFDAQVRLVRATYGIEPGEIDLPLLPIFALFNPALGMTTIVPEIDPRRPAEVEPARIVQAIQQEKVTNSFGSPTLWRKIGDHCVQQAITLPSVRRVLCAGAPVPAALWTNSHRFLPNGRLHSPYGATEALPVASVAADEIDPTSVQGACVGRAVPEMQIRIIGLDERPIASIADAESLPPGEVGEIAVCGPVVTTTYDGRPDATAAAKMRDPSTGAVWHRMGDCGFVDEQARLWFCGRKVERVVTPTGTFFTEPCEQVFRQHPAVGRCALIGIGTAERRRPALVVEARPADSAACRQFARELQRLADAHAHTAAIRVFYFHPRFPVDVRHNAKIHRLTLARWAATAKGFEIEPRR